MSLSKIIKVSILLVVTFITLGCGDPNDSPTYTPPTKSNVTGDPNPPAPEPIPSEFALIGGMTKLNDNDVCYVIEYLPTRQRYMVVRSIVYGRRWEQSDTVSLSVTHLTSSEVRR